VSWSKQVSQQQNWGRGGDEGEGFCVLFAMHEHTELSTIPGLIQVPSGIFSRRRSSCGNEASRYSYSSAVVEHFQNGWSGHKMKLAVRGVSRLLTGNSPSLSGLAPFTDTPGTTADCVLTSCPPVVERVGQGGSGSTCTVRVQSGLDNTKLAKFGNPTP
jgi:hypothetical protein